MKLTDKEIEYLGSIPLGVKEFLGNYFDKRRSDIGNKVISVSTGNVIRYVPSNVPVGTRANYLVISEDDIICIEEEFS